MSGTITISADGRHTKAVVPAGTVSDPVFVGTECVVTANPGAGGTMLVEATFSLEEDVRKGAANWFSWDNGTVSAPANQELDHATAVRFTATLVDGVGEVSR
jgi:hypothetical protein